MYYHNNNNNNNNNNVNVYQIDWKHPLETKMRQRATVDFLTIFWFQSKNPYDCLIRITE